MFDLSAFNKAVTVRNRDWAVTHKVLYDLCSSMPGHEDLGEVRAKLLIIGRAFATGIERAIPSEGVQGSAVEQLACYVCRHARRIDRQMTRLRWLDGSSPEHLREAVAVHGELMKVLAGICRRDRSPRSFCSKYLHFHFPFVPIFDQFSKRGLVKSVRWTDDVDSAFAAPANADREYCRFCKRFWILFREARQRTEGAMPGQAEEPFVKKLDDYLCYLAGPKRK